MALVGYDCVMIPGARSSGGAGAKNAKKAAASAAKLANSSQFCGSGFGLVLGNKKTTKNKKTQTGVTATICCEFKF